MSEESGRCALCCEYMDHYGRSAACYNPKCHLYLETGPVAVLASAMAGLVPDRPKPIVTMPSNSYVFLHFKNGDRLKARIYMASNNQRYWATAYNNLGDALNSDITGWTPVEEVKP